MQFIYLKNNNDRKKGDIVDYDPNSFFTIYWLKKGILQHYPVKVQDRPAMPVKTLEKGKKRGKKK